jgi:replicative DNA helicase
MIYKQVTQTLIENREKRLRGDIIAIPWSLQKISRVVPGVEKAKYIIISAGPKAGKSQLCDFLYLYEPFEWYLKNKDKGKSLKILYFSLEMAKESKVLQAISFKLNRDYGIKISPQNLKSTFDGFVLNERVLSIILSESFQKWLKALEEVVTFVDDVRSSEGIHKYVTNFAAKRGKVTYKEENGIQLVDKYVANNPDEYVIVITDHVSLLSNTKSTLFEAIYTYSAYHCLEFRDRYKNTVVNFQQQSADSAKQQYSSRGDTIIEKIRPGPDGLADCRLTSRDCDFMISLFNPASYHLSKYEGIDLDRIGRWHRELYINLNREGLSNVSVQLLFNGAVNEFKELPRDMTDEMYNEIEGKLNETFKI